MTKTFAVAIKLFIVMAILLFMSQIANFTDPEIETQHHHPPSTDASFIAGLLCPLTFPESIRNNMSTNINTFEMRIGIFNRRITNSCCIIKYDVQTRKQGNSHPVQIIIDVGFLGNSILFHALHLRHHVYTSLLPTSKVGHIRS